ncbi:hypothetical protein SAMN06265173_15414 [Thalassovita litoralis]|uniref:Uncharacterized protein n=1 Tax=Thalassovita litoralis TaxID=1010611 RepID=A0A521FTC3_9RHOB|nr:hypothetical protein SAMN06265173_15414 [Thalassovita litoralis]
MKTTKTIPKALGSDVKNGPPIRVAKVRRYEPVGADQSSEAQIKAQTLGEPSEVRLHCSDHCRG